MLRFLLAVSAVLISAAPAGVVYGLWLAVNTGTAVAVGSALYGVLGMWLLHADVMPDPKPREVSR